mmetsp:Transcript_31576/g.48982  ORF Transcript_31576/g.48982 Transcript_31576/m.48982 type:complete len:112 (+) Transcript_31576:47-382(+)
MMRNQLRSNRQSMTEHHCCHSFFPEALLAFLPLTMLSYNINLSIKKKSQKRNKMSTCGMTLGRGKIPRDDSSIVPKLPYSHLGLQVASVDSAPQVALVPRTASLFRLQGRS